MSAKKDERQQGDSPTVIKKYANRRLYHTGTSTYVTLEDLATMVKQGEDFVVTDAKSGEDITRSVLTQIIFEQEGKGGQNLLPIAFLRQLIRFYGDSMQAIVPSYLTFSLDNFVKSQERFRENMAKTFGGSPFEAIEDQVRRNAAMFEQAMRVFTPFGVGHPERDGAPSSGSVSPASPNEKDIETLQRQMSDMQQRLEELSRRR
jgi:polyhydroxyalkanoate synthesis repressor PhaR